MGSIDKRVHKDGKGYSWVARWRDPDGTERKRAFRRKVDAEDHLADVEGRKRVGTYVPPNRVTVQDAAEDWYRTTVALKPSTRNRYRGLLDRHVIPSLGAIKLVDLRHGAVQAWVAGMTSAGLAPSSVRQAFRVLSLALGAAVRDQKLGVNPSAGVTLPRLQRGHRGFLEPEGVARVLAESSGHPEIGVLLLCGLRMGEMVGLRVGDVDHLRRRLNVRRSITEVGGRHVTTLPKSHAVRAVPFPARLADALAGSCAGRGADEPLFTSPKGHLLRARNWRRDVWDPVCERAGVTGLTPHGARHTAASLMIAGGGDVRTVASALGHSTPSTTLTVYSHLLADRLDAVASAVDALVPVSCPPGGVTPLRKGGAAS